MAGLCSRAAVNAAVCCITLLCVHVLMRRKEERSKQGQTNNKAKQHSTPKVRKMSCLRWDSNPRHSTL